MGKVDPLKKMTMLDDSPEGDMGWTRKTLKPEKKLYRFTLIKDQDREIMEFLDAIPKPIREVMVLKGLKLLIKAYMSRAIEEIMVQYF